MPKIGQKSNLVKGQEKESILNCKKKRKLRDQASASMEN